MKIRLGVNIDHVATLRQARGESYPSLVSAAQIAFDSGADQLTIHLREDRRHIQDTDVEALRLVTKKYGKPLNFEMGSADEIIDIAIATAPDWICLVPENRQEKTTEGGLDLLNKTTALRIAQTVERLKNAIKPVKISLFLEANLDVLSVAKEMPIDAVEIHTGEYARQFLHGEDTSGELARYAAARDYLRTHRIAPHAGHGLTRESVEALLDAGLFEEYNIGHWIICQGLFDGMGPVIKDLRQLFDRHPLA